MRIAVALVLVVAPALASVAPAHATKSARGAKADAVEAPRVDRAAAAAARAKELLAAIEKGPSEAARKQAIDELIALGPRAVPALVEHTKRQRRSSVDERREVLRSIKAAVPDEKGRFLTPARQKAEEVRADDEFDWLPLLLALDPATPGVVDAIVDDALIRALAASEKPAGAEAILDMAFDPEAMVYRDECGRYLRRMAPASIPALIRGQVQSKNASLQRYAMYQLERLDREEPSKALAATIHDEHLAASVLGAYRDTQYRLAVNAVLDHIDHISPIVRNAAREAWMAYVTGPPPPPAPKKKLTLPGGKLTDEEQPLWLTHRELADIELRKLYEELFGEKPAKGMNLEEQSNKVFAHYDAQRTAILDEVFAEGEALAGEGKHDEAVHRFDRILAGNPKYERRATMAPTYFEIARGLEKDGKWREASAAFSKAHALDPQHERATRALAGYHYTLGRALEADGKDGGASFARAIELDPGYGEAREAAEDAGVTPAADRPRWMLYTGIGGGAGAVLLLALGLMLRKR